MEEELAEGDEEQRDAADAQSPVIAAKREHDEPEPDQHPADRHEHVTLLEVIVQGRLDAGPATSCSAPSIAAASVHRHAAPPV